ncbi:restriction endonuclease [Pseudomonas palleroniana]|uniref:restriction endonuclease n=1 Tax=Pseudomonas palleroniana TaxID=191390 RepID=UPI001FCC8B80|nr:restriction endonuclease [Pseudomonas palleroniana]UOK39666.1 restriction endonuclease [Pseudomonas palleroniana]
MSNIRAIDMMFLEEILEMGSGYVLNFSDRTFALFFAEELNIDIDAEVYKRNGTSKAKRLRCFLQSVDKPTLIRALEKLWEYREAVRLNTGSEESVKNANGRLMTLMGQLQGHNSAPPSFQQAPVQAFNREIISQLKNDLIALSQLDPHPRGYAFERFLQDLFKASDMDPREPFRLRGEQIDGSFQLNGETYLIEAKWHGNKIGVAELHSFHGKLEQKAAWTRGIFVSNSGFTDDGILAFGRGKRVICIDGLDLYEMLDREIPWTRVLELKVRRAAETGLPFIRVRELFSH